jgi:hypothetical protein
MSQPNQGSHSHVGGSAIVAGVAVGTVIVLAVAATFVGPFHLTLSPARSGRLAPLDCASGQCVNVTIRFSGVASLDPAKLHVAVLPYGSTDVVNGSAGTPLNMAYQSADAPHWVGDLGGGKYSQSFVADVVNPDGQLIGSGGAARIASGAVLCLKDNATGPNQEYQLSIAYMGIDVVIPFATD